MMTKRILTAAIVSLVVFILGCSEISGLTKGLGRASFVANPEIASKVNSNSYAAHYIDNDRLTLATVNLIDPDARTTKTFCRMAQVDSHAIRAVIDSDKRATGSDGTNNVKAFYLPTLTPDLIIETITWLPESPSKGDIVTFSITIKNQGNRIALPFRVSSSGMPTNCSSLTEAINQITLAQELDQQGKLEACGGAAYLSHLVSIVPTSLDIEHYAQIVYRLAISRRLIEAARRIEAIGYEADPDVEDSLGQAEGVLFKLRRREGARDLTHIRQVLDKYFEAPTSLEGRTELQVPYVLSNYTSLDEFLDGFQRSELVIIGGRPSMGKTSLALNIARNAAVEHRACVALFSLEMARDSLALRLLSSESGVNSKMVRLHREYGKEKEEYMGWKDDEERIMGALGVLSEAPIYVDDTPMLRVAEMRGKAVRLNSERGIDLIIVDYLQLMLGDRKFDNRVQEVSEISRSLKGLARELNVPVLAVSQLSRAPEGRALHEPQLSDLRESGSIEQDADVVLFIYREEYYYPNEQEWLNQHVGETYPREVADVIIAKNRNGPTNRIKLRFRHDLAKFENMASEEPSLL